MRIAESTFGPRFLVRDFCATCQETTLHDHDVCVHCKSVRPSVLEALQVMDRRGWTLSQRAAIRKLVKDLPGTGAEKVIRELATKHGVSFSVIKRVVYGW